MSLFREGVGDDAELLWVEPVTVERLVAALIAEGGEIQATSIANVSDVPLRILLVDGEPGRYLVYGPLSEIPEVPT